MSFIANSQTHSPIFPDTNAVWIQTLVISPDPTVPWIPENWEFRSHYVYTKNQIGIDTVYNKLYQMSMDFVDYDMLCYNYLTSDYYSSNEHLIGKYRVDGNKVYYKHLEQDYSDVFIHTYYSHELDSSEIILYDFGLEVNDTFRVAYANSLLRVSLKDSILINGIYYDRIFFEHDTSSQDSWLPYGYHWIAGVGSSLGFYPYFNAFERFLEFNCFHEDFYGFNFYPIGESCSFTGLSELSQSNFSIYPQPFTSSFTVSSRSELTSPLSYQLVDVFGRTHLQGKLENQTQTIDAKDLPAGMYFLKIDNGDGKSVGLRLIKY